MYAVWSEVLHVRVVILKLAYQGCSDAYAQLQRQHVLCPSYATTRHIGMPQHAESACHDSSMHHTSQTLKLQRGFLRDVHLLECLLCSLQRL